MSWLEWLEKTRICPSLELRKSTNLLDAFEAVLLIEVLLRLDILINIFEVSS